MQSHAQAAKTVVCNHLTHVRHNMLGDQSANSGFLKTKYRPKTLGKSHKKNSKSKALTMKHSAENWDPEWLDSMYNNRALVPDHADYFKRWGEDSRHARKSLACTLDQAYGDGAGESLDIFPAAAADGTPVPEGGAPVLVFIHGGYWRSLDKADHSFIAPAFTAAGACVVIPNYALCPAVTIPEISMQMVKALAWTWRNIADHGGNPRRITVVGHSAGGHLAAMLLACQWMTYAIDLPSDVFRSALSISGVFDLEPLRHTPFLKDSLQLTPEQVSKASPALLPRPRRKTLYSVAGGAESAEFLRQNRLIQEVWGRVTVPICGALAGLNHFSILEALIEPSHRLHELALELLGLDKPVYEEPELSEPELV
jgi:arylformamidase